jgi:hypothetical protein
MKVLIKIYELDKNNKKIPNRAWLLKPKTIDLLEAIGFMIDSIDIKKEKNYETETLHDQR